MTLIDYTSDEGIAVVTMDDGKVNALSFDMLAELQAAFDAADAEGCAVVLRGRPGVFSAGFDLATLGSGADGAASLVRRGFELAARMLAHPRPVVAACGGHAFAMGTFLLLAADHRIGVTAPHKITANEVAIGLTMPRAAVVLCRRLASTHHLRAVVQAEVFDPCGAVVAGFLDEVVDEAALVDAALHKVAVLTSLHADAFAATKARVHEELVVALRAAMDADEVELRQLLTASPATVA